MHGILTTFVPWNTHIHTHKDISYIISWAFKKTYTICRSRSETTGYRMASYGCQDNYTVECVMRAKLYNQSSLSLSDDTTPKEDETIIHKSRLLFIVLQPAFHRRESGWWGAQCYRGDVSWMNDLLFFSQNNLVLCLSGCYKGWTEANIENGSHGKGGVLWE